MKNKESFSFPEEMFYVVTLFKHLMSILVQPGWSLPVSFNDPLVPALFGWCGCLSRVEHHVSTVGTLEGPPSCFPVFLFLRSPCTPSHSNIHKGHISLSGDHIHHIQDKRLGCSFFFLGFYLFIFRQRGREGERD